jgi:hypothetical protein
MVDTLVLADAANAAAHAAQMVRVIQALPGQVHAQ